MKATEVLDKNGEFFNLADIDTIAKVLEVVGKLPKDNIEADIAIGVISGYGHRIGYVLLHPDFDYWVFVTDME